MAMVGCGDATPQSCGEDQPPAREKPPFFVETNASPLPSSIDGGAHAVLDETDVPRNHGPDQRGSPHSILFVLLHAAWVKVPGGTPFSQRNYEQLHIQVLMQITIKCKMHWIASNKLNKQIQSRPTRIRRTQKDMQGGQYTQAPPRYHGVLYSRRGGIVVALR